MAIYLIKDSEGNVLNRIHADEAFVSARYEHYEVETAPEPTAEDIAREARAWRDAEIRDTDTLMLLPDYPNQDALTIYRQALRDWPSTTDFPDTRPVLG